MERESEVVRERQRGSERERDGKGRGSETPKEGDEGKKEIK